jgi:hypothetical protein
VFSENNPKKSYLLLPITPAAKTGFANVFAASAAKIGGEFLCGWLVGVGVG